MTILFLVRHGKAEEVAEGISDRERELTGKGRRKFRKVARGLVRLAGTNAIQVVYTSPLVRARQTAEILAAATAKRNGRVELLVTTALGEKPNLAALVKMVRGVAAGSDAGVAAVGHEPTLSAWVGKLCFGEAGHVELGKGGVAAIRLADKGVAGELLWLATPEMLGEM